MSISDAAQRASAIDPTRSFCVSAPAGSGKTELLIQRYLALLARVQRPEQVLAITFTRKAAAEMRERVVRALQAAQQATPAGGAHQRTTRELARRALQAAARHGWHLVRDISRLNIRTIDSFCGALTRQMPVLSEFGGQASLLDDAEQLYAEAVAELFRSVDQQHPAAADLAALMLHFDNDWERLQRLLVAMLARREQWRNYVGVHHTPRESEAYLLQTVQSLVRDELGALAARLAVYTGPLLELLQYAARNLDRPPPDTFPGSDPDDVAAWCAVRALLLTNDGTWRKRLDKTIGFPAGKGAAQARKDQLQALLRELAELDGLQGMLCAVGFLPQIAPGSASWQLLVHLSRLLPLLAAQLLLVFQRHGAVDHNQVALAALQALGDDEAPTELALRLDYGIEHILVDEFQDTAINQYDLLGALTRGWGEHNAQRPQAPRTVMVVGDAMQSIYGFRGANVGLFLKARREGFNGVRLEPLELHSNFRSDAGVVAWINDTFAGAFPAREDINRGQVSFTAASAVRPAALQPAVAMHAFYRGDNGAAGAEAGSAEGSTEGSTEGQAQEVAFICAHIAALSRDAEIRSIAVLGRSRTHLQPVIAGLQDLGIAYSAAARDDKIGPAQKKGRDKARPKSNREVENEASCLSHRLQARFMCAVRTVQGKTCRNCNMAAMRCGHASLQLVVEVSGRLVFNLAFAVGHDLFHDEFAKGGDAFRLPQFLRIGEEDRHLGRFHIRQHADQIGEVLGQVIGQDTDAQMAENRLQHAVIVVHRQGGANLLIQKALHKEGARGDLRRGRVLADEAMVGNILDRGQFARRVEVIARRVKPHADRHQAAADQVGLARLLHADRHVGLAHRQVQHPFFQHQVDLEVGVAFVKLAQTRGEPERAEARRRGDAQFAKDLILAVADTRGCGFQPLVHRTCRVEQQFPLLGENQSPRMAVEKGGVQALLKRADLPGDRGLGQMKAVARMGQTARIGNRMKDSKLVPIHSDTFTQIHIAGVMQDFTKWTKQKRPDLRPNREGLPKIRAL